MTALSIDLAAAATPRSISALQRAGEAAASSSRLSTRRAELRNLITKESQTFSRELHVKVQRLSHGSRMYLQCTVVAMVCGG